METHKMDKTEILQKVIEKAVRNGWEECENVWVDRNNDTLEEVAGGYAKSILNYDSPCLYETIFSKNFAKAFWGNELICVLDGSKVAGDGAYTACELNNHHSWDSEFLNAYEYHLQQMVLEDDPLDYLRKFL